MSAVYLDSCIAIYLIEGAGAVHDAVAARLRPSLGPSPTPVISDLTRMECRIGPLKRGESGVLDEFERFFNRPEIRRAALTAGVFDLAAELRAGRGLRTPDAIHAAAALASGCDELWTNDRAFSILADRIKIVVVE